MSRRLDAAASRGRRQHALHTLTALIQRDYAPTMSTPPPHKPLVVLAVGGPNAQRLYRRALQAALPGVSVRAAPGDDAERTSAASARSHFAIADGTDPSLDSVHELFDALITTEDDLRVFLARADGFERRRRAHRLPPDIAPAVLPWSPAWAPTAARTGARVARVLADRGVDASVDHIGSTSVPGLAAKNIVDLQVSVTDLGMVDSCDADLRDAGFVNVQELAPDAPGVTRDKARGTSASPDEWQKRLYAGVDEAQRAIIHVRRTGAANWRYALLFRDWLRADDSRRDEYAATKLRIAEMHADDPHFDGYARSKDFWFDHAYEIAEEWAREVHWTAPVHRRAED